MVCSSNKLICNHSTALHQGLSKYVTVQDTHITPTLNKHSRTIVRIDALVSLHQGSTIHAKRALILSKLMKKKTRYRYELGTNKIPVFSFLKPNGITQTFWNFIILYLWQKVIHRCIFPQFQE